MPLKPNVPIFHWFREGFLEKMQPGRGNGESFFLGYGGGLEEA